MDAAGRGARREHESRLEDLLSPTDRWELSQRACLSHASPPLYSPLTQRRAARTKAQGSSGGALPDASAALCRTLNMRIKRSCQGSNLGLGKTSIKIPSDKPLHYRTSAAPLSSVSQSRLTAAGGSSVR